MPFCAEFVVYIRKAHGLQARLAARRGHKTHPEDMVGPRVCSIL